MTLSIVIPFYNEGKNITNILGEFERLNHKQKFELVCVNDGSNDDSSSVFKKLLKQKKYNFVRFIDNKKNGGYGDAIMTGVKKASGEVICWTHSDLQTPPEDTLRAFKVFEKLGNNKVIIKGHRVGRPFGQFLFSTGMAIISSVILGGRYFEINAQPKLFHRTFVRRLKGHPDDFSLDLFLLYVARAKKYQIRSIEVKFLKRKHGVSSWANDLGSRWKTSLRTIRYILRLKELVSQ